MTDGSREQPKITAGLDLGDKHSHLCLIDTDSGEVIEEGRLRTTPEALRQRFDSEYSLKQDRHRSRNALALGESFARRVRPQGSGR